MRAAVLVTVRAEHPWAADRTDLGDVARERQAGGPVDHRAGLPGCPRDLAHVVRTGHPPGFEATEGPLADLAHGLVAAQVDEGGAALVIEDLGLTQADRGSDVRGHHRGLPDRVLGG